MESALRLKPSLLTGIPGFPHRQVWAPCGKLVRKLSHVYNKLKNSSTSVGVLIGWLMIDDYDDEDDEYDEYDDDYKKISGHLK